MPDTKQDDVFASRDICASCGHPREFHFGRDGHCVKQLKPIAGTPYCKCKRFVESGKK